MATERKDSDLSGVNKFGAAMLAHCSPCQWSGPERPLFDAARRDFQEHMAQHHAEPRFEEKSE